MVFLYNGQELVCLTWTCLTRCCRIRRGNARDALNAVAMAVPGATPGRATFPFGSDASRHLVADAAGADRRKQRADAGLTCRFFDLHQITNE